MHGLLLANGCSWAHLLAKLAEMAKLDLNQWLTEDEVAALVGKRPLTELLPLGR